MTEQSNVDSFDEMRAYAVARIQKLGWTPENTTGPKFRSAAMRLRDHLLQKWPGLYKPWVEMVAYTAMKDAGLHY